ncbi:MAG: hypothetical protein IPJ81_06795 [Chitinophagaceae bacterium]|nr:hypothetical protein [Chitinophagaceae bacterium]
MGTFLEQAQLLDNEDFLKRIKIAIKKTATNVIGEIFDKNKESLFDKRHKLGTQVLNGNMTNIFADAIVSNNTDINLNSTDSDLEFMASSVFNDIAGVKITEQ